MKSKRKAFKIWKKQSNKKLKKKKFTTENSNITTESNVVAAKAQTLTEIFGNLKEVCKNLAARVQYCIENEEIFEEEEMEEDTDDEEEEHVRKFYLE